MDSQKPGEKPKHCYGQHEAVGPKGRSRPDETTAVRGGRLSPIGQPGDDAKQKAVGEAIEAALQERKIPLLARNALKALFAVFPDPVGALGQLFVGSGEAISAERQRLQQSAIIDLLCTIDDAIARMYETLQSAQASRVVVDGLIETSAVDAEVATGVHVTSHAGPVEFSAGTHIRTTGTRVKSLTGLRIGRKDEDSLD